MSLRPDDKSEHENQPAERRVDSVAESNQSVEKITAVARRTTWSGPLPPPAVLEQYDALVPGAAERIFRRWEKQSDHRMEMEKATGESDSRRSDKGLLFAFILSLIIISSGTYIAVYVQPWVGASIIGGNIAGLAGIFVYGTNARRRERERKASAESDRGVAP